MTPRSTTIDLEKIEQLKKYREQQQKMNELALPAVPCLPVRDYKHKFIDQTRRQLEEENNERMNKVVPTKAVLNSG